MPECKATTRERRTEPTEPLDSNRTSRKQSRVREPTGGWEDISSNRAGGNGVATPEIFNRKLDRDARWVARVRDRLTTWYAVAARDLPWRTNRDAYRILVSEMMLVQTTVVAVIPFFERFISRFPTAASLAMADELEVLKAWEGLGYYRRARQLHAAARRVVEEHGGNVPDNPQAVRALPGVGRYITGAILSFAFDRAEPIVEANSQRVLRGS